MNKNTDTRNLTALQTALIENAIRNGALKFNIEKPFKLKSGRESPYFFNAGAMNNGISLNAIAEGYVDIIMNAVCNGILSFDVILGPAYKGIPLATLVVARLATLGHSCFLAYDRKETKDHGEGGELVGASLEGKRVLVIDDVITAGTAFRESANIVQMNGGTLAGLVLMLDRQEKGRVDNRDTDASAVQDVRQNYGIPVLNILTLDDLMVYVEQSQPKNVLEAMAAYRDQYGVEA